MLRSTSRRPSICPAARSATTSPPITRPIAPGAGEALGFPIITYDRYEADDVIGTMTERAAAEGYGVAIVTGDKDFFQLVRDGIRVFNPRDDGTWYDAAGVQEKFGVRPDQ